MTVVFLKPSALCLVEIKKQRKHKDQVCNGVKERIDKSTKEGLLGAYWIDKSGQELEILQAEISGNGVRRKHPCFMSSIGVCSQAVWVEGDICSELVWPHSWFPGGLIEFQSIHRNQACSLPGKLNFARHLSECKTCILSQVLTHLWKWLSVTFAEAGTLWVFKPGVLVLSFRLSSVQHTYGYWKTIIIALIWVLVRKLLSLLWKFSLVKNWVVFMKSLNCSVFPQTLPSKQHAL